METMQNTAADWFVANALAVLALIVAVISLIQSHRATRRSNHIASEQLRIENAREQERIDANKTAKLWPSITPSETTLLRLVVKNTGDAEARNVIVLIDGTPVAQHAWVMFETEFRSIAPHSEIFYRMFPRRKNEPSDLRIQVTWDDDTNTPRSVDKILSR